MDHSISSLQRIQREAREAAKLYQSLSEACPYPWGTPSAEIFKNEFDLAKSGAQRLDPQGSDGAAEGHMCTCTGLQGLTSNELNTGRCDECGKAVIV